ncbi:MAG: hypothetical protein HOP19_04730 [Acidobacteria bacterium]|nr:hypothetical protein [Acidobacteriota bacterium]
MATGISFSVTIDKLDGLFTPAAELNVFRIVQEAVTNIVKHAAATQASVTMEREANALQVVIRDNGRGFDDATAARQNGVGLTSLAERVLMLNGTHHIESTTNRGTTITIQLPLTNDNRQLT